MSRLLDANILSIEHGFELGDAVCVRVMSEYAGPGSGTDARCSCRVERLQMICHLDAGSGDEHFGPRLEKEFETVPRVGDEARVRARCFEEAGRR